MSSVSKYAILGVSFAFASLQAAENGNPVEFVPQEAVSQNSATPSEPANSQQIELINVGNAGANPSVAVEIPAQNPEIQASETLHPVPVPNDSVNPAPVVAPEAKPEENSKENYGHEDVLGDMFSIGAYNRTVQDMKQQRGQQLTSTAVKVEDFIGPINVEADSPCNEVVVIPDWDRYSGDSAKTFSGWKRWWRYLKLKEPLVMNWVDGLVIRIYPKNEIYRSIFVNGIYDPNMVIVTERFLPKNGVMIEAGANMGYFSMLISKYLSAEGKIYALEPSKRDFSRLTDNVSINRLSKAISCHNLAVFDKIGTEKLTVACEERSALNTMGSAFSFKGVDKVEVADVMTITLDEFAKNEGIERLDVLKLDVEGSELRALQGGKNLVERFRPTIILGVNRNAFAASEKLPAGLKKKEKERMEQENASRIYRDIQQTLKDMRYKAYKLVTSPKFELQPVEDLEKARTNIVYCLHESIVPPEFEQPKQIGIFQKIANFFAE